MVGVDVALNSGHYLKQLGGQYDEWSSDWVYVPFENVTIENGGSIMIMELAAKLMGKDGLRMTLEEIVAIVADFDCGVYFTPEFLAANPGMKVTLELIVFNEENGELVDVIDVAKNEFVAPELPHVNTLVVGDTNKIVVSGETLNDWGLPIEWVPFVADEAGYYSFVGDNGAVAYIFTAEGAVVSATGAANLEAGTYLICLGNGLAGEFNVAVTKSAWVNALAVGANKIYVDGSVLNDYQLPITWVLFTVTEKANYAFACAEEGAMALIFDTSYNYIGAVADLEAGDYLICVGGGVVGYFNVTVTKTAIGGGEEPPVETPTHDGEQKVVLGDNTIVIDGCTPNLSGTAIEWLEFVVEEAGTYVVSSADLNCFIYDESKNLASLDACLCGFTGTAVLEPGTYYLCVGNLGVTGEFTVNIKLDNEAVVHKNTMVVGDNKYIITDALHTAGFELNVTIEITEPGTYVITGGAPMKVYFWYILGESTGNNVATNMDGFSETGFTDSFTVTITEAGTYYMGFNYEYVTDEREFDINISLKPAEEQPPVEDPTEEPKEEPKEEELGFWASLWAKILAFLNSIVEFFKNLF